MRALNWRTAVLAVSATLLLAGCSSTAGSTGTSSMPAASTTESTNSSTTSTTTSSVAVAPTSALQSSAADPGSVVTGATPTDDPAALAAQSAALESRRSAIAAAIPAEFDEHTTAWFDGICQPFADVDPVAFDKDGNGNLSVVEELRYYRAMSEAYLATSKAIAGQPPPTIPGGADLASQLTTSLEQAGTGFAVLLEKSADPNQEIMEILHDASNTYISLAYGPISSQDPAVLAALHNIPSCAAVGW